MQLMAARLRRATTSLKPQLLPLSFTDHKSGSTYGNGCRHRQSTAWPFELGSSSEDPASRAEPSRSFAPSSFRFSQATPKKGTSTNAIFFITLLIRTRRGMGCKRAGTCFVVRLIKTRKHLLRKAGAAFSSSEYLHRGPGKSSEPHS